MRRLWMKLRIPFAILVLILITLAMVRLFSGPEDAWIKNERGEWVRHGNPAGPAPTEQYSEPLSYKVVPVAFLVTFAVPLFLFGLHKPHNRLTFETATRDSKFYGYLSTSLILFGCLIGAGLILELLLAGPGTPGNLEILVIGALAGFAGLCILAGIQFFVLKRASNDHYQLEKTCCELLETLGKK